MAVKPTVPRVMNGKWGMVYLDGEPVYETDSTDIIRMICQWTNG